MQENPHGQDTGLPVFLTREDVADRLNLTPKTISVLMKRAREGKPDGIRSVRIGGSVRIPASELQRLAEAAS